MTLRQVRTAVTDGWDALTPRGRGFVSGGLSALAAAVALGLDDLARVGVLLLALPVVSTTLLTRRPPRLGLSRTVSPRALRPTRTSTGISLSRRSSVP